MTIYRHVSQSDLSCVTSVPPWERSIGNSVHSLQFCAVKCYATAMTLSGASVGRQETADYASAVTLHFGLPKCKTRHRIFVRRWLRRSFGQHADILVCRRTHEKWVKCTLQGVRSRITSGTDKTRTAWFVQNAPQKCSYKVGRLHSRVASTKCSLPCICTLRCRNTRCDAATVWQCNLPPCANEANASRLGSACNV